MLRLIGFFVLVIVLTNVLSMLPVIGPIISRLGIIGIWLTAILLSVFLSKWGERAVRVQKDRSAVQALQAVANPHNHGKLGSLFLAQGRPEKALPLLEDASEGDPDNAEWNYRLGCARLALQQLEGAVEALMRAVAIDPKHGFGGAMMRLAEAYTAAGHFEEGLESLGIFERNHGASPESAFRRGVALKGDGRKEEGRAAFQEVGELASQAARYKSRDASVWVARAKMAMWF